LPNWIINTLSAKGDPTCIREFLEAVKSECHPFDFNRIFPESKEPLGHPLQVREWMVDWGTGNPCDIELDLSGAELGCVKIKFETPWSPPGPGLLKRLQRLFPDIGFEFDWYDFDCDAEERLGFAKRDL